MSSNFQKIFDEYGDERVRDWFLMSSPFSLISILSFYIIVTKLILKSFMTNRVPLKLKTTLIVNNSLKIALNVALFCCTTKYGWLNDYSFTCQPLDRSNAEKPLIEATICWYAMMTKFLDMLDTVFILLRKKDEQITFLHTFHHLTVPVICWIITRFGPNGHGTFAVFISLFVNIFMYSYYLLAASCFKANFIKKFVTIVQILQCILIIGHSAQLIFIECDYPKGVLGCICAQSFIFILLLLNFYKKSYPKRDNGYYDYEIQMYRKRI